MKRSSRVAIAAAVVALVLGVVAVGQATAGTPQASTGQSRTTATTIMGGGMPAAMNPDPIATPDAVSVLRDARALDATSVVAQAKQQAVDYLSTQSPSGTTSAGAAQNLADVRGYVDELALAMCMQAAGSDPYRPRLFASHMFGWRLGLDNPDTVYRRATVTSDASYIITGRRNTSTFVAFSVLNGFPGDNGQTPVSIGLLDGSQLQVGRDGEFQITLDSTPSNGRPNHIQLLPGARGLLVRDTLNDWTQVPMALKIQRVAPDDVPPPPHKDALVQHCADWTIQGAPYWDVADVQGYFTKLPANTLTAPRPTGAGGLPGQASSLGNFRLTPDEALVVTVPRYAADYLGFQLGNEWFTSINYVHHTSSLNVTQSIPNADGSYTFVISLRDPGVWNWLDPGGHPTGLMFIRWQGSQIQQGAPLVFQKVSLANLASVLPAGTRYASAADRASQLAERQAEITNRFIGFPQRLLPFDLATFEPLI